MIKIHNKLWVIKTSPETNREPDLAYMTYADKEDRAFEKRQNTGISWARGYGRPGKCDLDTKIYDNEPLKGFSIETCVSRWSTSNKLFRIRDPRGFIVEIPSDNLAVLCKVSEISKGEIKDKCVWGREGNNHILLPISSDPYKEARLQTDQDAQRVSLGKMTVGDIVKLYVDRESTHQYVGRVKLTWGGQLRQLKRNPKSKGSSWYYRRWLPASETDAVIRTVSVKDTKWEYVFVPIEGDGYIETKVSGKAFIIENRPVLKLPELVEGCYCPERVDSALCKNIGWSDRYHGLEEGRYFKLKVVDVEWKEDCK